jgi:hypothetical protein
VKGALFIVIFVMVLKPAWPVLDYIVNYTYIAKELCVNKAKPTMHCNGKCHLMKELAKAAENEKPSSDKKSSHTETEVLFCNAVLNFEPGAFIKVYSPKNKIQYTNLYSRIDTAAIFHPPTLIS